MKMYLALRLNKSVTIQSYDGMKHDVNVEDKDLAGICYVFKSKAAAMRKYGRGVAVQGIEFTPPGKGGEG
jgi:hypothetical protein